MTWGFYEIQSITIFFAFSYPHHQKTSTDTNWKNNNKNLHVTVLPNEFHLLTAEGVFFPLLHECEYLGHLIRQPLIKNNTLLPWVKRWPFLNCFISSNLFHIALNIFGLMESELLLKQHLSPHFPPFPFRHPTTTSSFPTWMTANSAHFGQGDADHVDHRLLNVQS